MSKQLESRILPSLHLVDQLLVDLALSKKQVKNFPLPDAQQPARVHWRKTDEGAIAHDKPHRSRSHEYAGAVFLALREDEVAERLNTGNRAGENPAQRTPDGKRNKIRSCRHKGSFSRRPDRLQLTSSLSANLNDFQSMPSI
jgi:hypothetical protein